MTLPNPTPRSTTPVSPYSRPDVIPIRGNTPPSVPVTRPRVRSVPVERRPWRVLLVPPTPGAPTRAFDVARWQARLVVSGLFLLVLVAAGGVTALLQALDGPDVIATNTELLDTRTRLTAVEDSLAQVRSMLAGAQDEASAEVVAPVIAAKTKPAAKSRPLLSRLRDIVTDGDESGAAPTTGISADGLPVVGLITSQFSAEGRRHPLLHIMRPHKGVDVYAVRGTRITAPAAGRVTFVGRRFALGLLIEIEHADGVKTRYAHCRTAVVKVGQSVVRGTPIGTVGSSGLTTGPHLHYEIMVNDEQVNPVGFKFGQSADSTSGGGAPTQPD